MNTASRLEALTREHGCVAIVSNAAVMAARAADPPEELLAGFAAFPPQRVRGREEVMELWALGKSVA